MEIHRSADNVLRLLAPAKLNLYLEVLAKRADGFHEIETLMAPIGLFDTLRFRSRADGVIALNCRWSACVQRDARFWRDSTRTRTQPNATASPEPVDCDRNKTIADSHECLDEGSAGLPDAQQNLVYRAIVLLRDEAFGAAGASGAPGADIDLIKRIPLAAGLAGGSSDAAAALLAANIAWGLHWPLERLAALAGRLGSDVPFFLNCAGQRSGAAAICRGRGEKIESVGRLPSAWLVIVKPAAGLSTAEVYRRCRPGAAGESVPARAQKLTAALGAGDRRSARSLMGNRLEEAANLLSPWPARLGGALARCDCDLRQMSGSGTSYFGVGRHARHARRVARQLAAQRFGSVFVARS